MMYGGPTTSIADEQAREVYNPNTEMKCLVMWGTDVSYSCPAGGGRALSDLRAKGVKTVSIDPRFVPDAAKADVWLPIRPGTDVALMLCWIAVGIPNRRTVRRIPKSTLRSLRPRRNSGMRILV